MISKERLVEILDKNVRGYITRPLLETTADRILAAIQEDEPLACLVNRKGFIMEVHGPHFTSKYCIHLYHYMEPHKVFMELIYKEAEAKAREYLSGLPDKGGE